MPSLRSVAQKPSSPISAATPTHCPAVVCLQTMRGGPISNSRLVSADARTVTFRWKDYRIKNRDRQKTMCLTTNEFIRRFLIHVLPSGFHRIRHYGLLASARRRTNIAKLRTLLGTEAAKPEQTADGAQRPAASPTPDANAIEFYGTAAPSAEVNVQSKQGGTIIVLNGKEGDFVKKNALLVQFDESDQQLNLDKARSSRNSTLQQVQQAENNLKSALELGGKQK